MTMRTRGTAGRSLSDLPPRVYVHDCYKSLPWLVMPGRHESGPFQGSYGQPSETTQHLLGPIGATFGLLIHISLRSSTILNFLANRLNYVKFPLLKCAHVSLWLNPTGNSKFQSTSNHPPPATDSSRTALTS